MIGATQQTVRRWDTQDWKKWSMVTALFFGVALVIASVGIIVSSGWVLIDRLW